jgi:transcriptional regulator with XRE-family HTH domain
MDAATLLRRARRAAGLSTRVLARRAGTSHATVLAYEHGRTAPSVATFDRILRAAGFERSPALIPAVGGPSRHERGAELVEVLDLAAAFPARHDPVLRAPVFPRPAVQPIAPIGGG